MPCLFQEASSSFFFSYSFLFSSAPAEYASKGSLISNKDIRDGLPSLYITKQGGEIMSDNKENTTEGIDLSALQNTDFSALMSNVLKNVDMDKFKSVLSSFNMNNESMDKIMDTVSAPSSGSGSSNMDMSQLNSLASNVLKNMDVTKLQSVVSSMAGDNANTINGLVGSLLSNVKQTATPTANTSAPGAPNLMGMLSSLLSGGKAPNGDGTMPGASTQNVQNIMNKFKPPVDLATSPIAMIGGTQNDLKSQFEALLGSMNMDPASKDRLSGTLDSIISKPMVSMDSIKNGLGGINLQQLTPMLSNIMESFKPQKK